MDWPEKWMITKNNAKSYTVKPHCNEPGYNVEAVIMQLGRGSRFLSQCGKLAPWQTVTAIITTTCLRSSPVYNTFYKDL